jgi:hypothetical protein
MQCKPCVMCAVRELHPYLSPVLVVTCEQLGAWCQVRADVLVKGPRLEEAVRLFVDLVLTDMEEVGDSRHGGLSSKANTEGAVCGVLTCRSCLLLQGRNPCMYVRLYGDREPQSCSSPLPICRSKPSQCMWWMAWSYVTLPPSSMKVRSDGLPCHLRPAVHSACSSVDASGGSVAGWRLLAAHLRSCQHLLPLDAQAPRSPTARCTT